LGPNAKSSPTSQIRIIASSDWNFCLSSMPLEDFLTRF
jgi:hypothetical protein